MARDRHSSGVCPRGCGSTWARAQVAEGAKTRSSPTSRWLLHPTPGRAKGREEAWSLGGYWSSPRHEPVVRLFGVCAPVREKLL